MSRSRTAIRPPGPARSAPWKGLLVVALATVTVLLGGCADTPTTPATPAATSTTRAAGPAAPPSVGTAPEVPSPPLRVETVATGLDHPWDVTFVGGDRLLVTERSGALVLVTGTGPGARVSPVRLLGIDGQPRTGVYARGQAGLMGIAAYPDVATSGSFLTCEAHQDDGTPTDIRVVAWRLSPDGTTAQAVRDPLVGGLPLNPSGQHSECRPTFAPDGSLLVGTSDTARATIPEDLTSLGGKVLRVDPLTGAPADGNPFGNAASAAERLVSGSGHRTVQAVAIQPSSGRAWSVEQGPGVDDEVNVVVPGADYGWDPARGGETPGGYDETVPMTDLRRHPDAVPAAWSSGRPAEGVAGADFLAGPSWGDLAGVLAVATLDGQQLLLLRPDETGPAPTGPASTGEGIATVAVPPELDHTHGRLRGARLGPDGALYLTTDNGGPGDAVLRVTRA